MRKLLICFAVSLSYGIGFIDQSVGGCNCNSSSTLQNNQERNNITKIISNSSQTSQSAKSNKKLEEEKQFIKELQELEEFLEKSEEENNKEIENSE